MDSSVQPFLLLILDGFGLAKEQEHNAVALAKTPTLDKLLASKDLATLQPGGLAVGLPAGQMGNSEVGHLTIGAGRMIPQSLTRMDLELAEQGSKLIQNKVWAQLTQSAQTNSRLHLWGLVSDGGVHSHVDHLIALIHASKSAGIQELIVHAVLDGRDTPPQSAAKSLQLVETTLDHCGYGPITDICGRFYAMDRDENWDRMEKAWNLYVKAQGEIEVQGSLKALAWAYEQGHQDEFVPPVRCVPSEKGLMQAQDTWLCTNFRADRSRQMAKSLHHSHAKALGQFDTDVLPHLEVFSATQYSAQLNCQFLFEPIIPENSLGEVISKLGLKQLRIAETEKYAHVTYFFNGGKESVFEHEDRCIIPSPAVRTYDLKPEMSALDVTDKLCQSILKAEYSFMLCNLANGDMVGHTGDLQASIKAVEVLDACVASIMKAIEQVDGQMILTADHGNCELMVDPISGNKHTSHTTNQVPCVYFAKDKQVALQKSQAADLTDLAPTVLNLMGLDIPPQMSGQTLFRKL